MMTPTVNWKHLSQFADRLPQFPSGIWSISRNQVQNLIQSNNKSNKLALSFVIKTINWPLYVRSDHIMLQMLMSLHRNIHTHMLDIHLCPGKKKTVCLSCFHILGLPHIDLSWPPIGGQEMAEEAVQSAGRELQGMRWWPRSLSLNMSDLLSNALWWRHMTTSTAPGHMSKTL